MSTIATPIARIGLSRMLLRGWAAVSGPLARWGRPIAVRAYRRVKNRSKRRRLTRELQWWKGRSTAVIDTGRRRPHAGPHALGLSAQQARTLESQAHRDGIAIVAGIDLDGCWHSRIGPIHGVPARADSEFLPRIKFRVEIVWSPTCFGVRKRYRGNHHAFLSELSTLDRLGRAGLRVPSILDIDFGEPSLVLSYIPGHVLREALVQAGAPVRNRDFFYGRMRQGEWRHALSLGRAYLSRVVTADFIAELARDLKRFHELGVMVRDIKWDNIIIGTDGHPWWIDFHSAEDHSELSREGFRVLADLDVERFNRLFGTELPTTTRRFPNECTHIFGSDHRTSLAPRRLT